MSIGIDMRAAPSRRRRRVVDLIDIVVLCVFGEALSVIILRRKRLENGRLFKDISVSCFLPKLCSLLALHDRSEYGLDGGSGFLCVDEVGIRFVFDPINAALTKLGLEHWRCDVEDIADALCGDVLSPAVEEQQHLAPRDESNVFVDKKVCDKRVEHRSDGVADKVALSRIGDRDIVFFVEGLNDIAVQTPNLKLFATRHPARDLSLDPLTALQREEQLNVLEHGVQDILQKRRIDVGSVADQIFVKFLFRNLFGPHSVPFHRHHQHLLHLADRQQIARWICAATH